MADRAEYFREYNKKYRAENKDKVRSLTKNWQTANKDRGNAYARKWHAEKRASDPVTHAKNVRKAQLKRRYGITLEQYDTMLAAQGGHCALCDRTPEQEKYKHLNVDHCHATGKIRGLLCTPHNHALGQLGDDEAGLLRAIEYIRGGI